jgi:hypothetical protein
MPGALLAALLLFASAPAAAAEAAVATELPAGQSKSIRLSNLPLGTTVMIRIASSGRLLVALVGAKQLKRDKGSPKAVFRGAVDRKLTFRIVIPETDDYYLVLNNRRGAETLSVETEIRALRGRPKPAPENYSPRPEKASISPSASSI